MTGTLFSTPRPEPGHTMPALLGASVIVLALPIYVISSWNITGWALAAALFAAVHLLDLLLAHTRSRAGTVVVSGVQALGVFLKSIGLLAVLFAAAASDPHLALGAALTYALAFTAELGLSLVLYFGGTA